MAEVVSLDAAWTQQYRIVHGIAQSMGAERQRGNEAGVRALRPFFDSNVSKLRILTAQLDGADLSALDRWILAMDAGVRELPLLPSPGDWKPIILGLVALGVLFYFGPALSALVTPRRKSRA